MRSFLILLFALLSFGNLYGQKKLTLYKSFGGVVYVMDDTVAISSRQVSMLLKNKPEAFAEFKMAKRKLAICSTLGFAGGLLLALPIATAVAGGEPEWIFAGAGGALVLVSLPFAISFRGHAYNAIEIYNSKNLTSHHTIRSSFHLAATGGTILIRF
jgi:hypothetical protein